MSKFGVSPAFGREGRLNERTVSSAGLGRKAEMSAESTEIIGTALGGKTF